MESNGRVCDLCWRHFPTQGAYDQHLFTYWELADDLKSFTSEETDTLDCVCEICHVALKNQKGLKQHMGKVHPARFKGVYCPTCHKKFKHKYALRFHVNQVHKQVTRVQCLQCGAEFYNKYLLRSHCQKQHCGLSTASLET